MKRKFLILGILLIAMTFLPISSFAWTTPTVTDVWSQPTYTDQWSEPVYTDIWSEPVYTDIWSKPIYTDIWSEPIYTDIWSEPIYTDQWSMENVVYQELEEGSVRVSVTRSYNDYYFALLRSVDFNDFEYYQLLTEPYYDDINAKANHTYTYVFAVFDKNGNLNGVSNFVVVKVLPKQKPAPSINRTIEIQINNRTAKVDGKNQTLDVAPFIENNRTLVPLRFVSEAMGAKVDWNSKERKVTVNLDGRTIVLWIDKRETIVDGKKVYLDVPAKIYNDYTFVPIRFVSENFGREVSYDPNTKKVTIKAKAGNVNNNPYLFATWKLWVPGGFDHTGGYTHGAGGDTLQIKSDGTYTWKTVGGQTINGKWVNNGTGITLKNAQYDWDWNVSETQLSDGKGIKVTTLGLYYEGRK